MASDVGLMVSALSLRVVKMGAAALIAWVGMVIHNLADLPISMLSPENTLPAVIWIALFALWAMFPNAQWAAALLAWGCLNVVGAVTTILPLAILPFAPEQTVKHYAFHLLYLASQFPLLLRAWAEVRTDATRSTYAP